MIQVDTGGSYWEGELSSTFLPLDLNGGTAYVGLIVVPSDWESADQWGEGGDGRNAQVDFYHAGECVAKLDGDGELVDVLAVITLRTDATILTMAHEALHAAAWVVEHVGPGLKADSEAQAYLVHQLLEHMLHGPFGEYELDRGAFEAMKPVVGHEYVKA